MVYNKYTCPLLLLDNPLYSVHDDKVINPFANDCITIRLLPFIYEISITRMTVFISLAKPPKLTATCINGTAWVGDNNII